MYQPSSPGGTIKSQAVYLQQGPKSLTPSQFPQTEAWFPVIPYSLETRAEATLTWFPPGRSGTAVAPSHLSDTEESS